MDDKGGKTSDFPTGSDSRRANKGKDVRKATTMQHYDEHIQASKAAGATHLKDAKDKNTTHAGILASQAKVPTPLPKPQLTQAVGTPMAGGEHQSIDRTLQPFPKAKKGGKLDFYRPE